MFSMTRISVLFALVIMAGLHVSCGSSNPTATQSLSPDTINLDLGTDIRGNLIQHFTMRAGKPPVNRPPVPFNYRFDFQELERTVTAEGAGIIRGAFLFSINNQTPKQGIIEINYTPDRGIWRNTGQVQIIEQDINPVELVTEITNSTTGEPLQDVEVIAQRPDGLRSSRAVHTDNRGVAELEVLAGEFQITVKHPDFHSVALQAVQVDMNQIRHESISLRPNKLYRAE